MTNVVVKSVRFFTPVNIEFDVVDDVTEKTIESHTINGGLDFVKKDMVVETKIIDTELLKQKVFEYLANQVNRPEGEFEAPDDVYEQAGKAQKANEIIQSQVGEENYV